MHFQVQEQAPAVAVFLVFVLSVAGFSVAFQDQLRPAASAVAPLPATVIDLPPPGQDQDLDGYADGVDHVDGDAVATVTFTLAEGSGGLYAVLSTQDDQWRFGAGRALPWLHVYDPDPFGHDPGSPAWQDKVLRTGAQWRHDVAVGEPTTMVANVRDDAATQRLSLAIHDRGRSPDRTVGTWQLEVDMEAGAWHVAAGTEGRQGTGTPLGAAADLVGGLRLAVDVGPDLDQDAKQTIAARWMPVLHFAADEAFRPTRGEVLERFHGFYARDPDHRTWTLSFNNGRDTYRLLVADFNGDGRTDHQDVVILTDVLRAGGTAPDTVYAHVTRSHDGRVVVQYWFLGQYNYVVDDTGRDVSRLAHAGDREFIQLVFADEEAARNGTPQHIAYSQHYAGIRIEDPAGGLSEGWLLWNGTHPHVYVARGSHASYPVPGDDSRLRRSFIAYGDRFPGDGETWLPGDYELQVLGAQPWHLGYKWGPATRYHRDLGTTAQPVLQHNFHYPFIDPLPWSTNLQGVAADRLHELYNTPEAQRP